MRTFKGKLGWWIIGGVVFGALVSISSAQTAATGALAGTVTDASGAIVPGVEVEVTDEATGAVRSSTSKENGAYLVPLLPPGSYRVKTTGTGFKVAIRSAVRINVTETTTLDIGLELGSMTEQVTVSADTSVVQTESSALGRVVNQEVVTSLPLNTRNYLQILSLSPGITMGVANAAELGRGSQGTVLGQMSVHGSRVYDHNFQMDGVEINDFETSTGGNTAGVAVPNPDTIEEFKAQTGQYDAAFGRNAGANINVVTKSGTNEFHGTAFEFFRNKDLNANDFFFNRAGQPKPVVSQNQYGFTLGGPIEKQKLFFFGSYQGTRQENGLAAGQVRAKCSSTITSPPLTNDRSAAALGKLFAGQTGQQGGVAIAADGSNINPVSLRLLQEKAPGGGYLFPTPQVINPSLPFASQGFSVFSIPCSFDENQYLTNVDFLNSDKSKLSVRFFTASSNQNVPFPSSASNVPGAPVTVLNQYYLGSISHSYTISPRLFNEARIAFYRIRLNFNFVPPFTYSSLGIQSGPGIDDVPSLTITGSYTAASGNPLNLPENFYSIQDSVSYVRGRHSIRMGGDLTYTQDNVVKWRSNAALTFLSFPDFLLGMNGTANGSGFSNVFASSYTVGTGYDRANQIWNGALFVQDDVKLTSRLTLNIGLRYERIGQEVNALGENANLVIGQANPNPPAGGTLQGWVVPANYSGGPLPAGITKLNNNFNTNGDGQNNWAPRAGLAWQPLPRSSRVVVRTGYGVYYTRTVGQIIYNALSAGPFLVTESQSGVNNTAATLANPFVQPVPSAFPTYTSMLYSPTTVDSTAALALNYRPPIVQQYSVNVQLELARNLMLEIGGVGTRGTHLVRYRSVNQALLASTTNPIRGITTNTVANILQRVPIEGWSASGIRQSESAGASWYNGLEVSLTKRFTKGLQFLASYTWSKNLDTDGADFFNSQTSGTATGNQNDPTSRYGPTQFNRPQRLIVSYLYQIPWRVGHNLFADKLLGGWALAGVTTIQSGQSMTITATNANNVFGITTDRAQLAAGCTYGNLVTSGAIDRKLTDYFNSGCFAPFPVIGSDGKGTGFGDSGVGIVLGPAQDNYDISVIKRTLVGWPRETANLEFRAEFFNTFNHPQFANPVTNFSSSAFGQITSTAINPRIGQLALKFNF